VFPGAELKFYLDAPAGARAERRLRDYRASGREMALADVEEEVRERDVRDRTRPVGALRPAMGAEVVETENMTADEVVETLLRKVRARMGGGG
jgi:cytidylate kinase